MKKQIAWAMTMEFLLTSCGKEEQTYTAAA